MTKFLFGSSYIRSLLIIILMFLPIIAFSDTADCNQALITQLNKLYTDESTCDSSYCPGVFVHTFDHESSIKTQADADQVCPESGESAPPWCPSVDGVKKGAISFSMLRQDITPKQGVMIYPFVELVHDKPVITVETAAGAGYIFTFESNNQKVFSLCFYPVNAVSDKHDNCGCGKLITSGWPTTPCSASPGVDVSTCKSQLNPNTADQYIQKYKNPPGFNANDPADFYLSGKLCSISNNNFNLFKNVTKLVNQHGFKVKIDGVPKTLVTTWNEILIKSWEGMPYSEIPLKAFFYFANSKDAHGMQAIERAWTVADQYYQATGTRIPVVEINLSAIRNGSASPFECGKRPK